LVIFVTIVIGEIYARLAYHFFRYEFTADNLKTESEIIWKKYSNISYERVQNVDIQRGIIARIFGFSTVNIQTARYSMPASHSWYGANAEGCIPAVDVKESVEIREFIMKKISKKGN
jgi:uncharacterized membrane protein YdbT with pleckstrin-like domain